jgi:hypothetical protein
MIKYARRCWGKFKVIHMEEIRLSGIIVSFTVTAEGDNYKYISKMN